MFLLGNIIVIVDSGVELGKDIFNFEDDIGILLFIVEEDMKRIDSIVVGVVKFVIFEYVDFEKGVICDDVFISVDGVFVVFGDLAEGEGVEVESGFGDVEKFY